MITPAMGTTVAFGNGEPAMRDTDHVGDHEIAAAGPADSGQMNSGGTALLRPRGDP